MNDKRALFFAVAAVVCLALVAVAPADYRCITIGVGITYLVLAALSWLDHRTSHRDRR